MMVFMPLVVIGQFFRDVIGRYNVKVAVIGWLLFYSLLFGEVCPFKYFVELPPN